MRVTKPEPWFEHATSDLASVRALISLGSEHAGAASYLLQQAAEKLVKALLVSQGIPPRKSHDAAQLVAEIGDATLRRQCERLGHLSVYAVTFRYLGEEDLPPYPQTDTLFAWAAEIDTILKEAQARVRGDPI